MSGLLDGIRTACRLVSERARHVRIAHERIPAYAASLPLASVRAPAIHPAYHYLGHGAHTVAFVLTLDAVNFGSGYFPALRTEPGVSGYFTVAGALTERFRARGPLAAEELAGLRPTEVAALFGQALEDPPVAELMTRFAGSLNELGRFLLARFGGSFTAPVEAAEGSAERLVEILAEMRHFRDEARYGELVVPFYKRAQITAADLALAFSGDGWGAFRDLHRLTLFADNAVPHVLRLDGILAYAPALAARIDAAEPLPAGSPEEVEIRAAAVHTAERVAEALRARGTPVTPMELDNYWWHASEMDPRYRVRPPHLTRTIFY